MKTAGVIKIFGLMISFLLIAITPSGAVVAGEKEVVLDSGGQPVRANAPYYIWKPDEKAWISRYGNRTFAPFSCPRRVVLFSNAVVETPPPVIFVLSSSDDVVRVSTELNIMFARRFFCRDESGYWRVANSSLPIKEVVLSGSKSTYDSTFTIQKSVNGSYKFAFGSADKPTDIGLDGIYPGISRLVLSNSSSFGVSFIPG
ncbi:hypothetical protein YC2023_106281 [Brassica napus]|uniref:(rape) hypothetical protein n=1 Tax=Brassica napus TaxID=3708 RepID=A0A816NTB9_BRANA|nr:unnamed protein product [Brassica napus]